MAFSVKDLEVYPTYHTPLWAGDLSNPGNMDKALKYLEARGQHGGLLHWGQGHLLAP